MASDSRLSPAQLVLRVFQILLVANRQREAPHQCDPDGLGLCGPVVSQEQEG